MASPFFQVFAHLLSMDLVPPVDLTDLTRQHFLEFTEPSGKLVLRGNEGEIVWGYLVTCCCRIVEYRYLEIENVYFDERA